MIDHRPRTQFTPHDLDGVRARFRRTVERALKRVSEEEEAARLSPAKPAPLPWAHAGGEASAMRGRRKRLRIAPRVRPGSGSSRSS